MDYTNKIFANIAKDMAERRDSVITRAFISQIAELLQKNGIMPICTERYMNINSDKSSYSIIKKINISFDELDCTEHDREVRKQAYRDFIKEFESRANSKDISEKLFETECILLERDKNETN
jgi:hypothetical protein